MDLDLSLLGGTNITPTLHRKTMETTKRMANRMGRGNQIRNGSIAPFRIDKV
jgi:hypothetical protein